MIRNIIQIGDKILDTKCKEVTNFDSPETQNLIKNLLETCMVNADVTAGLSAPQIGELYTICVCRRTDLEELTGDGTIAPERLWEVMINPKIVFKSIELSVFWEACLSVGVGDNQLWGPVERSKNITIEYTSPTGEKKSLDAKDFFAHIIQHELDHLDGVLFLNYVKNPENIWKSKILDKYLKKFEEFPPIK